MHFLGVVLLRLWGVIAVSNYFCFAVLLHAQTFFKVIHEASSSFVRSVEHSSSPSNVHCNFRRSRTECSDSPLNGRSPTSPGADSEEGLSV